VAKKLLKMTLIIALLAMVAISFAPSHTIHAAETSTFSGVFDGSEQGLPIEYCFGGELPEEIEFPEGEGFPDGFEFPPTPYDLLGPIRVTVTGTYSYVDLSIDYDIDIWLDILLTNTDFLDFGAYIASFDDYGEVVLTAGVDYYFLVTPLSCLPEFGIWEFSMTGPGSVEIVSDGRLNPTLGDTEVILYPNFDEDGNRTIEIYCVNPDSSISLGLTVSQADLPAETPAQNTLIAESSTCLIQFWALGAGNDFAYQVNFGPNGNGNIIELLFNDFLGRNIAWTNFNTLGG